MSGIDREQLRLLVREVVRDAVRDLTPRTPRPPSAPTAPPVPAAPVAPVSSVAPTGPLAADEKSRTDSVRIASDSDLDGFVRKLLNLFENPKTRADLRHGRLSFRLANAGRGTGSNTHRIDRGAVTERQVADLAGTGATLVLGPRAILTPLARERARALGITVQKERK
ncbi:MAG: hypothetical protein WBB07_14120 [Mycobacterium sp.]